MKKEKEIIELNLKRLDVEDLEKSIKTLRDHGLATLDIDGKLVMLFCEELIDKYEDFSQFLSGSGLSSDEIQKHFKEINQEIEN